MNRGALQRTAKLLDKAVSTDSTHEAMALVEHAYSMLARVITERDPERGEREFGPRRRERRLTADRRRSHLAVRASDEGLDLAGSRYGAFSDLRAAPRPKVNLEL